MANSQRVSQDYDDASQFLIHDDDDDDALPNAIAGTEHSRQCLLNSDEETDEAEERAFAQQHQQRWRAPMVGLVGISAVLAFAAVKMHGAQSSTNPDDAARKFSVINNAQPEWQVTTKERDLCSKVDENCFTTECCKTTGYKCYQFSQGEAKCMKTCTVGEDSPTCEVMQGDVQFEEASASNMFCFSVYTHNTGSPKPNHELQLLSMQRAEKKSIFACDDQAVYSDVTAELGGGFSTIRVYDVEGDFHFAKRKETGSWVNTGMFKQVWKHVGVAGSYKKYAWTVKVDPDAVFVPHRLVQRIHLLPRPTSGIFLVNCKHVDNGFFGNLEVFSSMAFSVLVANIDKCNSELPWKVGVKNGEYGPMGEDLFAEKCMEKNGVAKAEAFDITIDGACPADRPENFLHSKHWHANCGSVTTAAAVHPFKKPDEYFECLSATESAERKWR